MPLGLVDWLFINGEVYFARTIPVHFVGVCSGLVATLWVGPRKGRFINPADFYN